MLWFSFTNGRYLACKLTWRMSLLGRECYFAPSASSPS